MRAQRLSSCLSAAGKLCGFLLLNLNRWANVNTSCAGKSFRFSRFHKSSAVWDAGSAAHASLSAVLLLLCLLLQSFDVLLIVWREAAFCAFN